MGIHETRAGARAFLAVFVFSTLLAVTVAYSDGTTTTSGIGPGFDSTLPPQFNVAQTAGLGQVFQSCMGDMGSAVSSLGTNLGSLASGGGAGGAPMMMGMGFGMNAVCPGSDDAPDTSSLTCDTLAPAGIVDQSLLNSKLQAINMALATAQCKQAKFSAIRSQVQCLSTQADVLSSQVASLQNAYTQNIQRMQQDVAKIKSVQADRDMQLKDVQQKLSGNGDSGSPGLLKLKEATVKLINEDMPQQIQDFKDKHTQLTQAKQALEEQVQTRTMALANECFSTRKHAEFRCAPNGPPVTAKDYALCRYQQNQNLGEGGVVEQNQNVQAQADANSQGLGGLLDQMLGDAPKDAKIPTNPQDALQALDQPVTVLTAADMEAQYGDELTKYNGKGLDIHDFVMKQVGNCFNRANRIVTRERKVANSQIGVAEFQLKQQERDLNNQANSLMEKYSQQWSDDMAGLTGMNLPLDTSACKSANANVKANCLDDIRRNFEGLLQGNVKQSAIQIQIKGNDPNTTIRFKCQGLNGCITALQNTNNNLVIEKQRLDTFKKDYVLKANQSVQNYTKQMAGVMSQQSQQLNNKLKEINSAMASLGVSQGINIQGVQSEQLQTDDDGLPKPPNSALNLIGSQMSPPMLDVSANNFSSALGSLGQGVQDENKKMSQINDARNRLATLPTSCGAKTVQARMTQLQNDVNTLASANCGAVPGWCDTNATSLQTNAGTISSLSGVGIDPSVVSNLSTGMNVCMGATPAAAGQASNTTNVTNCNMASNRISTDVAAIRGAQSSIGGSNAGGATLTPGF